MCSERIDLAIVIEVEGLVIPTMAELGFGYPAGLAGGAMFDGGRCRRHPWGVSSSSSSLLTSPVLVMSMQYRWPRPSPCSGS